MRLSMPIIFVLGILLIFCGIVCAEEITVMSLDYNTEKPSISLRVDYEDSFRGSVLDVLKSGQKLSVDYDIKVKEKGWFGDTLVSAEVERIADFQHRNNVYTLVEEEISQYFDKAEELFEAMLWLDRLSVLKKQELEPGQEVSIEVRIKFSSGNKDDGLLDWLALDQLWKSRTLIREGDYIVH